MIGLTQDYRLTLKVPEGMSDHEVQEAVLQQFPEQIGGVQVEFVRIVTGLVDSDDVPIPPRISPGDKR